MLEIYKNRLKKEDDQFMKSAGVIKSTTAVYGNMNIRSYTGDEWD